MKQYNAPFRGNCTGCIIGPLPATEASTMFMLVVANYFTNGVKPAWSTGALICALIAEDITKFY